MLFCDKYDSLPFIPVPRVPSTIQKQRNSICVSGIDYSVPELTHPEDRNVLFSLEFRYFFQKDDSDYFCQNNEFLQKNIPIFLENHYFFPNSEIFFQESK